MMFQVRTKKAVPKVNVDEAMRAARGAAPGTKSSPKVVVRSRNKPTDKHDKGTA